MDNKKLKKVMLKPGVEYSGLVKMRLFSANGDLLRYEVHNEGKESLFKFVSKALCGYDTTLDAPNRLDIVKGSESVISGGVGLSSKQYLPIGDVIDGYSAIFRAYVSNAMRSYVDLSGDITIQMCNYYTDPQTHTVTKSVFASVDADSSILTQMTPGSSLQIEWIMNFKNADTEASS